MRPNFIKSLPSRRQVYYLEHYDENAVWWNPCRLWWQIASWIWGAYFQSGMDFQATMVNTSTHGREKYLSSAETSRNAFIIID